jgi:hypothetical protein
LPAAGITEIDAAVNAATVDPAIRQFRPVAGAVHSGFTGAHVKFAVGVTAERKLFFESIHGFASQVENGGGEYWRYIQYGPFQKISIACD